MVRYKKRGRAVNSTKPSKVTFDYQYYDLNMSAEEMARHYNVKETTIYNWATEFRKLDKIKEISN